MENNMRKWMTFALAVKVDCGLLVALHMVTYILEEWRNEIIYVCYWFCYRQKGETNKLCQH